MDEDYETDNSYPNSYLYTPGKWKTTSISKNVNSTSPSEKSIAKMTTCNNDDKLFKPVNLFSSDIRRIDIELKNMHKLWSNID